MPTSLFKNLLLLFVALVSFQFSSFAQNPVTGKVIDPEGNPVSDVTVQVLGSNVTTITNQKGDYSISAKNADVLVLLPPHLIRGS